MDLLIFLTSDQVDIIWVLLQADLTVDVDVNGDFNPQCV